MSQDGSREREFAYLLFRIMLGINICLHGVTRLAAGDSGFAENLTHQFAHSALPHFLVQAFGYCLPWAEAVIGFLIAIGLFTPLALAAGFLLMILLTFGTSLLQQWEIAGLQLIYGIAYAGLLGLVSYNRYSLDSLLLRTKSGRS